MPTKLVALLTGAVLSVGVAACGGSGSSNSSTAAAGATASSTAANATTSAAVSTTASAAASSSTGSSAPANGGATTHLELVASTSALTFNKKTLTAEAGTVTIAFTNNSTMGHNLTIEKGTSGETVGATPTFAGGSKTLTVKLAAGTYTFYCSVPGHRAAGMRGTLIVS